MATIKPTNGPEAPISSNAFLSGIGSLIDMNAPSVPIIEGACIKNGSDAFTLFHLAAK